MYIHCSIENLVFGLAVIIASLGAVATFCLIFLRAYVRWTANQNFTFLGGNELEVLTASTFLLVLGMVLAGCGKLSRATS